MSSHLPESFRDLLALAMKANVLTWTRASQTLSLTVDDRGVDRRLVVDARLDRQLGEARQLRGFNPAKNQWTEYCAPPRTIEFPDKRGLKALRSWLEARATEQTGFPNPPTWSLYRQAPPGGG